MYNILVTGANGQLGNEIKELSGNYRYKFIFTNKDDLDITDTANLSRFFENNKIDVVINCAAFTNVDKAENNRDVSMKLNCDAVRDLAVMTKRDNILLVHISTDYVFDGTKNTPYSEGDAPNPISVYGMTKYEGEKAILENSNKAVIIRTSWLYSSYGSNFVKTIMRHAREKGALKVVYDQIGTPTYAHDLANAILNILPDIGNNNMEIYHYSNEGVASWYDFAKAIIDLAGISTRIEPIETIDYPTPAKRPYYSVLNKTKVKKYFNVKINHWYDSLKKCMEKLK